MKNSIIRLLVGIVLGGALASGYTFFALTETKISLNETTGFFATGLWIKARADISLPQGHLNPATLNILEIHLQQVEEKDIFLIKREFEKSGFKTETGTFHHEDGGSTSVLRVTKNNNDPYVTFFFN